MAAKPSQQDRREPRRVDGRAFLSTPPEAPPAGTVADRLAAQVAEYGQWVAVADILVDGALAYRKGHAVPVSNVERHGYDRLGLVTPAGNEVS